MRTIDVSALIDGARFNAFHARVLFWCALIIIFDGYDLVIYGVVLPSLMSEWGLSSLQAGALGSCALVGMMLGALFFGSLSDRIGRRKTIMMCVAIFSGVTAINGLAQSPEAFALCRFIAGLGIGGVMPNVVALMNEYAPKKSRSTLVAIMFSGYSLGGMLSASLGMVLIPQWGWQAVFYVALIPLLALPLLIRQLPESMDFLLRTGQTVKAQNLLAQAAPSYEPTANDQLTQRVAKGTTVSIAQLFQDGRKLNTFMLWLAFFCCLLMVYALSSWLPKLMTAAGYGLNSSLAFLLALNVGAIIGAVAGGWLGDRIGIAKVLFAFFTLWSVSPEPVGAQGAVTGALSAHRHRRGVHHWHADPGQRLHGAVLPRAHTVHRAGLGDGRRSHRSHHRSFAGRRTARFITAAAGELSHLRRTRADRGRSLFWSFSFRTLQAVRPLHPGKPCRSNDGRNRRAHGRARLANDCSCCKSNIHTRDGMYGSCGIYQ